MREIKRAPDSALIKNIEKELARYGSRLNTLLGTAESAPASTRTSNQITWPELAKMWEGDSLTHP